MNTEEKMIGIQDFAQKVGLTRQAIYKRVDGDLSKYTKIVNGKKKISVKAFDEFQNVKNVNFEDDKKMYTNVKWDESLQNDDTNSEKIKQMQEELDLWKNKYIELQDKHHEEIRELNESKDKIFNELNQRLIEANKLNENNQVIIQTLNQKQLFLDNKHVFFSWFQKNKKED